MVYSHDSIVDMSSVLYIIHYRKLWFIAVVYFVTQYITCLHVDLFAGGEFVVIVNADTDRTTSDKYSGRCADDNQTGNLAVYLFSQLHHFH